MMRLSIFLFMSIAPACDAAQAASIIVDCSVTQAALQRQNVGVDMRWSALQWQGRAWLRNKGVPSAALAKQLSEYRVEAMRFPGGLLANQYRWKRRVVEK